MRPAPRRIPPATTCVPSKIWNAPAIGRISAASATTSASVVNKRGSSQRNRTKIAAGDQHDGGARGERDRAGAARAVEIAAAEQVADANRARHPDPDRNLEPERDHVQHDRVCRERARCRASPTSPRRATRRCPRATSAGRTARRSARSAAARAARTSAGPSGATRRRAAPRRGCSANSASELRDRDPATPRSRRPPARAAESRASPKISAQPNSAFTHVHRRPRSTSPARPGCGPRASCAARRPAGCTARSARESRCRSAPGRRSPDPGRAARRTGPVRHQPSDDRHARDQRHHHAALQRERRALGVAVAVRLRDDRVHARSRRRWRARASTSPTCSRARPRRAPRRTAARARARRPRRAS